MRHGDGTPGNHTDGFCINLTGDVCVLQNVVAGINAQISTGENDVGIYLHVRACACRLQQHVTANDIDAQGTCIGVTIADQNRSCGSLQYKITGDQQV